MSDLRELYQEMIIDHGRNPRNVGVMPHPTHLKQGYNPLCGDKLTVYLEEDAGVIKNICFEGCGCAISMASASLMSECVKDKSIDNAKVLFAAFHQLVTEGAVSDAQAALLGKLMVMAGVSEFPARVKCASLAWHTLNAILSNDSANVSTE